MNEYQKFIHTSRYARWIEEENRRETWEETVSRYIKFIVQPHTTIEVAEQLKQKILNLDIMPSMRALMTAGPAATRDNTCLYNCYYNAVDSIESFSEAMYILMCGTGVGFSVEQRYVEKLPVVQYSTSSSVFIMVGDSKEGWSYAFHQLLEALYAGHNVTWDLSLVRPAGAKLKTFGGRASGPEPLGKLFEYTRDMFFFARGRKLTTLECHDLMCKIAEIVVVGGVRRSALISLSDLPDDRLAHAKSGEWWTKHAERSLANNSAVYNSKPSVTDFLDEWTSLVKSGSGERGIFNREAARNKVASIGRREYLGWDFGTNPCSEIILRPGQFCNLTEVVVRSEDKPETLREKVRYATILGTIQSTYTYFPRLRDFIRQNTEEERLLGVSLTGIMDNMQVWSNELLAELKTEAVEVNQRWASSLGISASRAITCVKPSGTVSQLVDAASGIHPRHSDYYIRRVRGDVKDPLTKFMVAEGFPMEQDQYSDSVAVFSFPMKAPENSITREDITAVEHLEFWLEFARDWCEHKPSITVNVKEHEWMEVGAFVYKHFDEMSGVSFLPYSDHTYVQAPYEEITEEEYNDLLSKMPTGTDWSQLSQWERDDHTKSSQTFACTGDVCEVVDITE